MPPYQLCMPGKTVAQAIVDEPIDGELAARIRSMKRGVSHDELDADYDTPLQIISELSQSTGDDSDQIEGKNTDGTANVVARPGKQAQLTPDTHAEGKAFLTLIPDVRDTSMCLLPRCQALIIQPQQSDGFDSMLQLDTEDRKTAPQTSARNGKLVPCSNSATYDPLSKATAIRPKADNPQLSQSGRGKPKQMEAAEKRPPARTNTYRTTPTPNISDMDDDGSSRPSVSAPHIRHTQPSQTSSYGSISKEQLEDGTETPTTKHVEAITAKQIARFKSVKRVPEWAKETRAPGYKNPSPIDWFKPPPRYTTTIQAPYALDDEPQNPTNSSENAVRVLETGYVKDARTTAAIVPETLSRIVYGPSACLIPSDGQSSQGRASKKTIRQAPSLAKSPVKQYEENTGLNADRAKAKQKCGNAPDCPRMPRGTDELPRYHFDGKGTSQASCIGAIILIPKSIQNHKMARMSTTGGVYSGRPTDPPELGGTIVNYKLALGIACDLVLEYNDKQQSFYHLTNNGTGNVTVAFGVAGHWTDGTTIKLALTAPYLMRGPSVSKAAGGASVPSQQTLPGHVVPGGYVGDLGRRANASWNESLSGGGLGQSLAESQSAGLGIPKSLPSSLHEAHIPQDSQHLYVPPAGATDICRGNNDAKNADARGQIVVSKRAPGPFDICQAAKVSMGSEGRYPSLSIEQLGDPRVSTSHPEKRRASSSGEIGASAEEAGENSLVPPYGKRARINIDGRANNIRKGSISNAPYSHLSNIHNDPRLQLQIALSKREAEATMGARFAKNTDAAEKIPDWAKATRVPGYEDPPPIGTSKPPITDAERNLAPHPADDEPQHRITHSGETKSDMQGMRVMKTKPTPATTLQALGRPPKSVISTVMETKMTPVTTQQAFGRPSKSVSSSATRIEGSLAQENKSRISGKPKSSPAKTQAKVNQTEKKKSGKVEEK
ncbi:MAG: hypothetical protein Q9169_004560 [Polycauliona sp. 2 TL-2023]